MASYRDDSVSGRSPSHRRIPRINSGVGIYRNESNASQASFMENVDMAQDEMFSGPVSESVPTSTTGFLHRGERAESTASFSFYDDEEEGTDSDAFPEEDDEPFEPDADEQDYEGPHEGYGNDPPASTYSSRRPSMASKRRTSSMSKRSRRSGDSERDRLLAHRSSIQSNGTGYSIRGGDRDKQKLYIQSEDLTIVIAGFRTSNVGFATYAIFCILTIGVGYLMCRWLARLKIWLIGSPTPLRECSWVVIENQWKELSVRYIEEHEYGEPVSTVFGALEKRIYLDYDEDLDPIIDRLRLLDYRYIRFCYHPVRDKFLICNTWKDPAWGDPEKARRGLDTEDKDTRERIFGKNSIDIEEKPIGKLLIDEVFHPFYVFQVASIILWSMDQYYYYAVCIFIISVVSVVTTLLETRATMKRLRDIARFECDVRILRNGFWRYVESSDLVPGDVYEITDPSLTQLPCDSLLLTGDCIVNESMLTGESIPVSKTPYSGELAEKLDLSASSVHPDIARHMLFCGTKIVRARRPQDGKDDEAAALALCVRTGFNTTKGALVRSMMFPKPSGFKFYRDSFRYISVMAGIAVAGFAVSVVNFIKIGLATHLVIIRALDLITIVVPPALPATLTIGTNFALGRLKEKKIFCISPQRVNVGGKLDVMCFDKTGTLTEEGLDVLGLRVVQRPGMRFSEILTDCSALLPNSAFERDPTIDYSVHKALLYSMATCHSLKVIENELAGDPLEIKMFDFTGWTYTETEQSLEAREDEDPSNLAPSVARPPPGQEYEINEEGEPPNTTPIELGILKQFEFISALRRSSVVVRQFGDSDSQVYLKGAPECMPEVCNPDSFPLDYDELLSYYTHRGYRVIGCAAKTLKNHSWVKVQKMKREEAENNLEFLGFIIFENKLKEATTDIIDELEEAGIRKIMCTGDNILTAISVARECHILDPAAHCFVPYFAEGDSRNALSRIVWESVDNPIFKLDEHTLLPLPPPAESDASLPYDMTSLRNYSTAITGDVFKWVINYAPENILRAMLVTGQVYARMSPDEKHELVEKLQSIDYTAGFCGDGANDCGALKAADVGISLSEAEASVAAPFTSRVFDISCVPQVIKEGRAALVTSFSCFKYMSLYSAIQFTSISILYASASNLADFQFLYIDLLLILPIAIFMGWTGPYPILSRKRPTASLVSRKVLIPLLGQALITIIIQFIAFEAVVRQQWFVAPVLDPDRSNTRNSENTTLFLVTCYQYILSAIVLSIGKPFRQSMRHNMPFVITIVVTLLASAYLLFDPAKWLFDFMELTPMSSEFKVFLLALGIGGFACAYASERFMWQWLARTLGEINKRLRPKKHKKRKEYKLILESMRF